MNESCLLFHFSSTSAQEVIQCLLDRFHIQESANKFALYEHTLETQTILSRKLPPSERPLSMVMHWVRSAQAIGEEFATAIRRKRIVLQENENWEVKDKDETNSQTKVVKYFNLGGKQSILNVCKLTSKSNRQKKYLRKCRNKVMRESDNLGKSVINLMKEGCAIDRTE
ncbi:hypothetical protein ACTXT7_016663 [Hymenolepis weldensis]